MLYHFIITWVVVGLLCAGIEGTAILYSRHPFQKKYHTLPKQYSRKVAYVAMLIGVLVLAPVSLIANLVFFFRGQFNIKKEGCLPDGMGCFDPGCQSCWQSVHEVHRK